MVSDPTSPDPIAPAPDSRGRRVDWKLLFNQLLALEIAKEHVLPTGDPAPAERLDRLLAAFTQYHPGSFNDAIDAVLAAGTGAAAHRARVEQFEHPLARRVIAELDFARSIGPELREQPAVAEFLAVIARHRDRPIAPGESFLGSPEGQNTIAAFGRDRTGQPQQVALVMVPGYAAHTIKFCIFEEMVADANRYHGRPAERPLLHADGIDLSFEDHVTYYGRGDRARAGFDILHPAGAELGNTTGHNSETTDRIAEWVAALPPRYRDCKLIFLGYSKGAPIVLDLVNRHPELSPRILGYVTHAGVVQGTHAGRLILEQAESILRDVSISEFVERLRAEEPESLARVLSPLFAHVDTSWLSVPRIRAVFEVFGYDITPYQRQVDRILGGREVRELLDGALDLSPRERVRWNLKYLDDDTFCDPCFLFNLSAITDVEDMVRPIDLADPYRPVPPLVAPTLTEDGEIDWRHLSLDALFLYFTSLDGFKAAPGGLFDTQVDLANTKSPMLDRRPLAASLTEGELDDLWADPELREILSDYGVTSRDALAHTPRCDLVPADRRRHIDAIDLGEFKGHHWSLFVQALRPPPELSHEHAVWSFPRMAFMRALLQVLALYNLVGGGEGA